MLKIYMRSGQDYNASAYYRILLPLHYMQQLDLPLQVFADTMTIATTPVERFHSMLNADINIHYQAISTELNHFIETSRTWKTITNEEGEKSRGPSFIVDTDDDIFNVHPLNNAYGDLGYKDDTGRELPAGEKIWMKHPKTNQPILKWADGQNVDYAKNKGKIALWKKTLELAELVTCSTPRVVDYVKREVPGAKTHVYPNCIDFNEYPTIDLREHPDEIRILWQGSTTHWEDLWKLREPFGRVHAKYPHIKWIFWIGNFYPWLSDFIPKDRVQFINWIPYQQYKLRLSTIGHDINLCPLSDTQFNRSRSAIKWYESSAISKPAATLAENTGPYHDEIEDGKTGLIYNTPQEFEDKLSELIENTSRRAELASNAKDWVKTNRDPSNHVIELFNQYTKVREERMAWPEPSGKEEKKLFGSLTIEDAKPKKTGKRKLIAVN